MAHRMPVPLVLLAALAVAGPGGDGEGPPEITVELRGVASEGDARLGYSSPRRVDVERTVPRFVFEVPRFECEEPLFFRVALGETKGTPFFGALDRSGHGDHHNRLYLDRNRDLDLTNDGPPVEGRIRSFWAAEGTLVEFLGVRLDLPYSVEGKTVTEAYPCVFYFVLGKGVKTPDAVLVERDGWREGTLALGGQDHVLAVVDDDSDGQFSTGDSWVLRPAGTAPAELLHRDATRSMLFPSWSADQKWTLEVKAIDPAGRRVSLAVKEAVETERDYFLRVARQRQTDEERRLNLDPLRPKADPNDKVDWLEGRDVAYARDIAAAPKVNKPLLLAFEQPNCAFCALMEKYTFRDREVVGLSRRFVCAKIRFAPGSADTDRYKVAGTPTYVILDVKGAEIARHAGFLRPTELAAWLKSALR